LNNIQLNDRRFGFFFVAPAVVILSIVILAPIVIAIITSFYDYTLINRSLDNFIGFLIAILLNQVERFRNVYYFILLIPLLINPVVVGLIWRMFLHPQLGILNYLIGFIGIEPVNWLGDPQNAFITIIFVDIWHQVSFMIILLLAGLASIPEEPYEAARVDGANAFQQFRDITLPYMRPVIIITLLIRLIFALKTYDLIYIMTKGGPGDATDLISYYIYRSAFIGLDLGQAASMSVILLFIVCIIIYPLFKYMSRADE
jgi:multiple sugar transport system permease protein